MLATLETGVKGGKWFSLADKVWREDNLRAAFDHVAANKGSAGVDHVVVTEYAERLDGEIAKLAEELQTGTYRPQPLKRVYIDKLGSVEKRPLGIPTVRDRTVHGAVKQVVEPIFEAGFAANSYGFRPGRGCKDALREVQRLLDAGWTQVVDVDIKSFFDTIDHELLMKQIEARISDGRLLDLMRLFLKQGVLDGTEHWEPEEGTPQGGVISPLLANIYLNPLDWLMLKGGCQLVRYADDMVILCRNAAEAEAALNLIRQWMEGVRLKLHPEKTRIVDIAQPGAHFDFLGYRFKRTAASKRLIRVPRPKSMRKLHEGLCPITKRCNGHSLEEIIRRINRKLRGWFEYFKHSYPTVLKGVDGWVRMRLRSILRKRSKRKGRGRGADHHRWPNAYFAEHGLFSCVAARAEAVSP
ncbi:MAG: group II intron reverse transcriptase/maturase [Magnetococcus sp. WYHC-3]